MGSIGDAYDNAVAESFFGTLQLELLDRQRTGRPRQEPSDLRNGSSASTTGNRRHSSIEMLSPIDYETTHSRHDQHNQPVRNNGATSLLPLRVRRIERVRLHADLSILGRLAVALHQARSARSVAVTARATSRSQTRRPRRAMTANASATTRT